MNVELRKQEFERNVGVKAESSATEIPDPTGRKITYGRQHSDRIGTDTTGAAIKTINNILNGITDSVNRLSEFQSQNVKPIIPHTALGHGVQAVKILKIAPDGELGNPYHNTYLDQTAYKPPVVKVKTLRKKGKVPASKLININASSNISIRRSCKMSLKQPEKKIKVMENLKPPTGFVDPMPQNPVKKRLKPYTKPPYVDRRYNTLPNKAYDMPPHKLVEIYHNNAAKESDSDEDRNKAKIQVKIKSGSPVPQLVLPSNECGDCKETIIEECYEEPTAPRSCCTNNYELPTIASRMKQAAKLGFNMFNFKAIPFCPVSSTTPSHNIGINIQQVMSIIKTRQPVHGISPTLAHNINLAAEKLNNEPLTSFVSSMTSKLGYGRTNCPLTRQALNYQHLQEMARGIPGDTIEECEENDIDPMNSTKTMIITGPSGDMEVKCRNNGPWSSDHTDRQCTCVPQLGVNFQQVFNKYRGHQHSEASHQLPVSAKVAGRRSGRNASRKIKSSGLLGAQPNENCGDDSNNAAPLGGKEKNLKVVLMNLHDEFEAMNKKYEALSTQAACGKVDEEVLAELETLEHQLNKKEEEITIVMTLYKEVMNLKQQVKTLKQKTSSGNIVRDPKPTECNSKVAHHLTKLLQHIQHH